MAFDLHDYRGPLGRVETQLARRRIAVAADPNGQLCLVRPDSVIVEFGDDDGYEDARRVIRDTSMEVLGGEPAEPPASRCLAARVERDARPADRPARWSTSGLTRLEDRFAEQGCTVRPNRVYLTDGVARHFRIVADRTARSRPGLAVPPTASSTVRPAHEPRWLPAPLDLPAPHRPPHVLVLDTGLRTTSGRPAHPWLRDHCVVHAPWRDLATVGRWDDEDEPDDDGGGRLDTQAGHGTFISGIVRRQCPDAVIHHRGVLTSFGDGDDASVIGGIERALAAIASIDIVVMAFGTYATAAEVPAMAGAIRRLLRGSLVVASAGNDATTQPVYPAALPGVVGVGALDGSGPAAFSNRGPWVDACAPGIDVVSTFFEFDEHDDDGAPGESYRGWARWSGTSFAAPRVAGVVAREQYVHGGTAEDAWRRIRDRATFRVPDLGIVVDA